MYFWRHGQQVRRRRMRPKSPFSYNKSSIYVYSAAAVEWLMSCYYWMILYVRCRIPYPEIAEPSVAPARLRLRSILARWFNWWSLSTPLSGISILIFIFNFRTDEINPKLCVISVQVDISEKPVFWKALKPPLKDKCGELLVSLCYHPTNSTLTLIALKARNLKAKDINGKSGKYINRHTHTFQNWIYIEKLDWLIVFVCFYLNLNFIHQILTSRCGSISVTNEWRNAKRPSTSAHWSRCLTRRSPSTCRGKRFANVR